MPSGGQSHFIKAKEDSLLSLLEQNNKAMGSLSVMDKGKIIYARAIGYAGITPEKWDWKDFGEIEGITINGGAGNKNKGIFISASEMALFGSLFLKKGNWNGRQVVPERWVKEATSPQIMNLIPGNDTPYGFNWWTAGKFPDAPDGTFAALGFNNNKCIVIPEWDMVIVRLGLDGAIDDEKWNNFIKMVGEAEKVRIN